MKHLNQNQEFRFNEVLFEHRNKEYGAYALRNESDRILTKALFVGVSLLAAISVTPFVISAFQTHEVVNDGGFILPPPVYIEPDLPKEQPAEIVKPQVVPEKVKTYVETVPEPTANVTNEHIVKKVEGAIAGPVNSTEGAIATTSYHPVLPQAGTGPAVPYIPPTPPAKVPDNHIADPTELASEAVFAGGIDSFRNKVINNFDGSGFGDDGGTMKTVITFIVEKDGTISGLKANGKDADFNNEAIRTIKNIKGLWKPAKNKQGESVRSYFKFPISMNFE